MSLGLLAILVLGGLLASSFFSGSETALFSAPRARLENLAKGKNRRARVVVTLLKRPRRLLATILFGNTLVNMGLGVLILLMGHGVLHRYHVPQERLTVVVLGLDLLATLVILVFAEMTPKLLAARFSQTVATLVAPTMQLVMVALRPVIEVFMRLTEWLMRLLGVSLSGSPSVTKEEIQTLVSVGENTGVLEPEEADMVEGFFGFRERVVSEIMIPRVHMVALSGADTVRHALDVIGEHGYSRYPVYEGTIDHITGILYAKDLLGHLDHPEKPVAQLLRPANFVPSTKALSDLLRELQTNSVHIAVVLDEYGGTHGMVTIEDLLEEIFGEIKDEYDHDEAAPWTRRLDGSVVADGVVPLHELSSLMGIPLDENEVDTVGGLVATRLGRLPRVGEEVKDQGLVFKVLGIKGTRIQKVLVRPQEPVEGQEQSDAS